MNNEELANEYLDRLQMLLEARRAVLEGSFYRMVEDDDIDWDDIVNKCHFPVDGALEDSIEVIRAAFAILEEYDDLEER